MRTLQNSYFWLFLSLQSLVFLPLALLDFWAQLLGSQFRFLWIPAVHLHSSAFRWLLSCVMKILFWFQVLCKWLVVEYYRAQSFSGKCRGQWVLVPFPRISECFLLLLLMLLWVWTGWRPTTRWRFIGDSSGLPSLMMGILRCFTVCCRDARPYSVTDGTG